MAAKLTLTVLFQFICILSCDQRTFRLAQSTNRKMVDNHDWKVNTYCQNATNNAMILTPF